MIEQESAFRWRKEKMYKSRKQPDVLTNGFWLEVSEVWGMGSGVCTTMGDNLEKEERLATLSITPTAFCSKLFENLEPTKDVKADGGVIVLCFWKVTGTATEEHGWAGLKLESRGHYGKNMKWPWEMLKLHYICLCKLLYVCLQAGEEDGRQEPESELGRCLEQAHLCAKQNWKGQVELLRSFAQSSQA